MGLFFPNIAYASIDTFIANVNRVIINPIIVLLFALAVVYFLVGLVQFLANQDNEEKKTAGKNHMLYGVIGMTIMFGAFMMMGMITDTLNVKGVNPKAGNVESSVKLDDYNPTWP
ncbi:MAG: hypothetical protein KBC44_02270 [Candidatus Pacebacteria bacterium]|nr:hypothetical protein [Candidatus Paceibacterota bacterium]